MSEGYVNFRIGEPRDIIIQRPSIYFNRVKKPEWFEDPFVKELLLKIEGTTVLFEEALKDRHGHGKSADKICNSCRSVIMMKFLPENTYSDEFFGKNCWPFIFRLAESGTHINIWPMTSAAHFDWYEDKAHLIRINGKPVKDISELIDSLYDWWSDLFDDKEG